MELAHFTVQSYLRNIESKQRPRSGNLTCADKEAEIYHCCVNLTYMNMSYFKHLFARDLTTFSANEGRRSLAANCAFLSTIDSTSHLLARTWALETNPGSRDHDSLKAWVQLTFVHTVRYYGGQPLDNSNFEWLTSCASTVKPMHWASRSGLSELVESSISESQAQLNEPSILGTALHYALLGDNILDSQMSGKSLSEMGNFCSANTILDERREPTVEFLLDAAADASKEHSVKGMGPRSPFSLACPRGLSQCFFERVHHVDRMTLQSLCSGTGKKCSSRASPRNYRSL
jgi:hypothetical protein